MDLAPLDSWPLIPTLGGGRLVWLGHRNATLSLPASSHGSSPPSSASDGRPGGIEDMVRWLAHIWLKNVHFLGVSAFDNPFWPLFLLPSFCRPFLLRGIQPYLPCIRRAYPLLTLASLRCWSQCAPRPSTSTMVSASNHPGLVPVWYPCLAFTLRSLPCEITLFILCPLPTNRKGKYYLPGGLPGELLPGGRIFGHIDLVGGREGLCFSATG